ncbi:uroporphyrinogen decarboxylase family protein [Magnetococcales bacterium HHB-1]
MNNVPMTSLQRVLTTLGHQEPDRVPLFLLFTVTGARELDLSIRDYLSNAASVAEGQIRLRNKYKNDCLYGFFYAAIEIEAWGGDVIWYDDGPPNAREPFIKKPTDIEQLSPPDIKKTPCLARVLEAQTRMKDRIGEDAPIIGVVISPFSLPIMQMGFGPYLNLIYHDRARFNHLMKLNMAYTIRWGNAQLEAGATAICYFDPLSSCTTIPPALYRETGKEIAKQTIAALNGPTATHFASGRSLPILDDVATTGTAVVGVSVLEELAEIKKICKDKLSILGNLNAIEMRRWHPKQAEQYIKRAIRQAGVGGGFILSDNHGEIPWQVPHEVLESISRAAHKWGQYPLDWVKTDEQ